MDRIDFARLKSVPIDSVLARYGVETKKRNGTYVVCPCPLPTHSSKDSKDSFAVNVEKNLWTCHSDSCKKASGVRGGDVIDLVCLIEGTRLPLEGARKLAEWFPQNGAIATKSEVSSHSEKDVNKPTAAVGKNKPLSWPGLQGINPEHPMIQSRGISVETAKLFGVGYYYSEKAAESAKPPMMQSRIVFPLYEYLSDASEELSLVGYAGRTTLEVTANNPKWLLPPGLHKTFLYGLERATPDKPIVLVESFWAVLWFHERQTQAAAVMGKELTDAQIERLKPFPTVIVAMDNDEPGRAAAEVIAAKLRPTHKVLKASLKEG